jgi:hypothetical protein
MAMGTAYWGGHVLLEQHQFSSSAAGAAMHYGAAILAG